MPRDAGERVIACPLASQPHFALFDSESGGLDCDYCGPLSEAEVVRRLERELVAHPEFKGHPPLVSMLGEIEAAFAELRAARIPVRRAAEFARGLALLRFRDALAPEHVASAIDRAAERELRSVA